MFLPCGTVFSKSSIFQAAEPRSTSTIRRTSGQSADCRSYRRSLELLSPQSTWYVCAGDCSYVGCSGHLHLLPRTYFTQNQGGALVHVYTDGTVLCSHGGTEMGQGLHTKVCQVAAQAFGIPLDDVYVNDSSTDKVANTIPTAASMSTDTYGMATLDACRQILLRLEPIREEIGPYASFKEVVKAAHFARIDLSAHGFFALDTKRCGFDWLKEKPEDFPADAPENSWKGYV